MDGRVFEAALTGDVQNLHQLLAKNPLILHTGSLASLENPLHTASTFGHVDFVKETIKLKPDCAKEVDQDGFSPMHIASANGHIAIVRELLKVDPKLCRMQGREKMNPLHCATIRGRVDVISFAEEVDQDGFSPMHIASANGHMPNYIYCSCD